MHHFRVEISARSEYWDLKAGSHETHAGADANEIHIKQTIKTTAFVSLDPHYMILPSPFRVLFTKRINSPTRTMPLAVRLEHTVNG